MKIRLNNYQITIQRNNQQTIRIVEAEAFKLQTRLRYVDVYNYYLRQEFQRSALKVVHTPSAELMADNLTKSLGYTKHQEFIRQISLVDL